MRLRKYLASHPRPRPGPTERPPVRDRSSDRQSGYFFFECLTVAVLGADNEIGIQGFLHRPPGISGSAFCCVHYDPNIQRPCSSLIPNLRFARVSISGKSTTVPGPHGSQEFIRMFRVTFATASQPPPSACIWIDFTGFQVGLLHSPRCTTMSRASLRMVPVLAVVPIDRAASAISFSAQPGLCRP